MCSGTFASLPEELACAAWHLPSIHISLLGWHESVCVPILPYQQCDHAEISACELRLPAKYRLCASIHKYMRLLLCCQATPLLEALFFHNVHLPSFGRCAGERMQLHRNGDEIQYFSRRGVEHGDYSGYDIMDKVLKSQLKHEKCILDGEMIVWNKNRSGRF